MNYTDLVQLARAGEAPLICYLFGENEFSKAETIQYMMSAMVDPATAAFNSAIMYADESTAAEIVNNAMGLPMMAPRRVVIVRNFQRLGDNLLKPLLDYASKPVETTCLILVSNKPKPTGKFFNAIKKKKWVIDCKIPYEDKLPAWVSRRFHYHKLTASPAAVQLLVQHIGGNLRALDNEIFKISIYIDERTSVEVDDVEDVVGIRREYTVFELCKILGMRDLEKALEIVDKLIIQGDSVTQLLAMIASHFAKLLKLSELLRQGHSQKNLAPVIGCHPFFVKDYIAQVGRYTTAKYLNILKLCLNTDYDMKRSYASGRLLLELLIYKICAKVERPKERRVSVDA